MDLPSYLRSFDGERSSQTLKQDPAILGKLLNKALSVPDKFLTAELKQWVACCR